VRSRLVIHSRRGDILKVLWFGAHGLMLLTKRLNRGRVAIRRHAVCVLNNHAFGKGNIAPIWKAVQLCLSDPDQTVRRLAELTLKSLEKR